MLYLSYKTNTLKFYFLHVLCCLQWQVALCQTGACFRERSWGCCTAHIVPRRLLRRRRRVSRFTSFSFSHILLHQSTMITAQLFERCFIRLSRNSFFSHEFISFRSSIQSCSALIHRVLLIHTDIKVRIRRSPRARVQGRPLYVVYQDHCQAQDSPSRGGGCYSCA